MRRRFVTDLHVHSVLSPCAAVEMTPRNIIWHAAKYEIDIIAIADHNAGANVRAALDAAQGTAITIVPAMEVETKEEVHVLTLFGQLDELLTWEKIVRAHLPEKMNDTDKFGIQFVVDAEDNLVKVEDRLLLTSISLGIEEVTEQVAKLGGICIASHVDRPSYSIVSQLGFIPPDIKLAALEVSGRLGREQTLQRFPVLENWPIIVSSDAHSIDRLATSPKMAFWLEEPTFAEIQQALKDGAICWIKA
jgi:3',5'-nucleoside bisphosphate phosphatase